ncbi:MAG: choice-of-anchor J domain-containing protein [Muribaculaceae bacterium]|nr:choice-of-anchor J domain-containing protein [Muribaculaceae bacterium]
MKKLLSIVLVLAVAVSASAGVNITRNNFNSKSFGTEKSKVFKTSHALDGAHASGILRAPITEAPEGESKFYKRAGDCLYVEDNYVVPGEQEGSIELIYAADNKVWFKNIFFGVGDNFGTSYVYGNLSADGTTITVPMGQSIYYSDYYGADVVLSWGTSSVGENIVWTPDTTVTEAVYVIDGNTITLQGGGPAPSGSDYPQYEANGLGSVWTDDGTFGGYLEWGTVLTEFVPATLPTNLAVNPTATTAYVTWDGAEGDTWKLRWRPWTDLSGNPYQWTFPLDSYEEELEGWWSYDADEDGYGWGLAYSSNDQDDVCLYSYSWSSSSGSLSPDNYIGTPDVPLVGELQFTVWGTSDSWPDVFQVYAMVGDDMHQLFEEDLETTAAHKTYTVDLSSFEGATGCIVFRHYNCTNQYAIYIDDVMIGNLDNIIEPAAWEYANDLDATEHTIEGLTPETKYEVQVMAYKEDNETDWTELLEFTTLAEQDHVVGDLNGDGVVDIADVNICINIILETNNDPNVKALADLSGDGTVDVTDVNMMINIILSE